MAVLTYPFVQAQPFGLLMSLLVLWFIGAFFEAQWGSRDFLKFFASSSIGAAVISLPLYFVVNAVLPFEDPGVAMGPGAALTAMFAAMAMTAPDSRVYLGFVLPVKAKTLIWIMIGGDVLFGLVAGVAGFSITLGGLGMGFLLGTGMWRPERIYHWLRQKNARRRSGLYVVPPKAQEKPQDRTLH